jgi:hypothetical protein
VELGTGVLPTYPHGGDPQRNSLIGEQGEVTAARANRCDPKPIRRRLRDRDRLGADRTSASQDDDAALLGHPVILAR